MTIGSLLSSYYLTCDIFGKKPRFTIGKSKSFQTHLGSTITIIVYIIIAYFICYYGKEIFLKEQPALITTLINDDYPQRINLTIDNFEFAIGLQKPNYTLFADETIFTMSVSFVHIFMNTQGVVMSETKALSVIRCSEHSFNILPSYFNNLDLNNLYCLKDKDDLHLEGEFGKEKWTYLEFNFQRCSNSSMNNYTCKSKKEIDDELYGGYLEMFLPDLEVSANHYKNPAIQFGKNIFTAFSIDEIKDVWVYLKTFDINTDAGLIINSYENERFYALDSLRETRNYSSQDNFLMIKLRASQSRQVYARSYTKVQTVAAYVGGIIKFILITVEILIYWFRDILYRQYILSFYFQEKTLNTKMKRTLTNISNSSLNMKKTTTFNNFTEISKMKESQIILNSKQKSLFGPLTSISKKNSIESVNVKKRTIAKISYKGLCVYNKRTWEKYNDLRRKFNFIAVNFDFVHYLKTQNDLYIIKSKVLTESQLKLNEIGYNFDFAKSIDNHLVDYIIKGEHNNHNQKEYSEKVKEIYSSVYKKLNDDKYHHHDIVNNQILNSSQFILKLSE